MQFIHLFMNTLINQSIIYFKQWLLIESRVQYTYAHVDKLYQNADKIHVSMDTQNTIHSHDLRID